MDQYVTEVLFGGVQQDRLFNIVEAVRSVRLLVKNLPPAPDAAAQRSLLEKLERCRNQDNNPDSQAYKRRLLEMMEEDEERQDAAAAMAAGMHLRAPDEPPSSDPAVPLDTSP